MIERSEEPDMTFRQKLILFLGIHWKGVICVLAPTILACILIPTPRQPYQWCGYTLLLMATFWVTEAIPLAVTSFLPVIIFPLSGIMNTTQVCRAYLNDTVFIFLGTLILAYSVEHSGLHKRLAYLAIRAIGISHVRLLGSLCLVTTFCSLFVSNTAATTMMVPINFALLRIFENQNLLSIYETNSDGDLVASDVTTCYFCAATFSATIGGIGTLISTATNLAFKGLFHSKYPESPEYLTFPLFSAFSVPYMLCLEACNYVILSSMYLGFLRPNSATARSMLIPPKSKKMAQEAIVRDSKKLGNLTFYELMVLFLFTIAMVGFFTRSPKIFTGWGDVIGNYFDRQDKFVQDSAMVYIVCFFMFCIPASGKLFLSCKVKYYEQLPKGPSESLLSWPKLDPILPFSYMFLLGGGFSLSEAASITNLNSKIGEMMKIFQGLPNLVVIFLIICVVMTVSQFASNVAVVNIMAPLSMQLAKEINRNPLWYCIVAGFTSSWCFMIPVGTPGNLIVQSAAHIPTKKMIIAGAGPTIATALVSWVAMSFWVPVIWPVVKEMPDWVGAELAPAP